MISHTERWRMIDLCGVVPRAGDLDDDVADMKPLPGGVRIEPPIGPALEVDAVPLLTRLPTLGSESALDPLLDALSSLVASASGAEKRAVCLVPNSTPASLRLALRDETGGRGVAIVVMDGRLALVAGLAVAATFGDAPEASTPSRSRIVRRDGPRFTVTWPGGRERIYPWGVEIMAHFETAPAPRASPDPLATVKQVLHDDSLKSGGTLPDALASNLRAVGAATVLGLRELHGYVIRVCPGASQIDESPMPLVL